MPFFDHCPKMFTLVLNTLSSRTSLCSAHSFTRKRRKKQVCGGGAGGCGGEGIDEAGLNYLEDVTAGDGESIVHRY